MEKLSGLSSFLLIILLFSSFVRISTVLSILKIGLGLPGASFGIVLLGLSLAISILVVNPQLTRLGGPEGIVSTNTTFTDQRVRQAFLPFLKKGINPEVEAKLADSAKKIWQEQSGEEEKDGFTLALVAFLISELTRAFELGLMLLIPFIVIDLLVTNIMMLLGVSQVSHMVVALPLKLLLFVSVGGWNLLVERLLVGYA